MHLQCIYLIKSWKLLQKKGVHQYFKNEKLIKALIVGYTSLNLRQGVLGVNLASEVPLETTQKKIYQNQQSVAQQNSKIQLILIKIAGDLEIPISKKNITEKKYSYILWTICQTITSRKQQTSIRIQKAQRQLNPIYKLREAMNNQQKASVLKVLDNLLNANVGDSFKRWRELNNIQKLRHFQLSIEKSMMKVLTINQLNNQRWNYSQATNFQLRNIISKSNSYSSNAHKQITTLNSHQQYSNNQVRSD